MDARRFVKGIVIGIIIIIALIIMVTTGNIMMFASIFSWVQTQVHVVTGFDSALSKAIAALITASIVALPFWGIILAFTPIPQKNKGAYRSVVFIILFVFFLFAYLGGKNVYFNPETGEVAKYYVEHPDGKINIYSAPGNDPITGEKLKPVTKEIALRVQGIAPKPVIKPDNSNIYFDPKTGKPIKWYSEYPNGDINIYSEPGNDPISGERLKPVTSEIVLKVKGLLPKPEPVPEPIVVPESSPAPSSSSDNYQPVYQSRPSEERIIQTPHVESRSERQSVSNYNDYAEPVNKNVLCTTTLQNKSNKTFIVINSSQQEQIKIKPFGTASLNLEPGKYFFRPLDKSSWQSFVVPRQGSFIMTFAIGNPGKVVQSYKTGRRY